MSRITVTKKGKLLQDELFHETLNETRVYPVVVKSPSHTDLFGSISPNDEAYSARSGYFRPKHQKTTSLKAATSARLYPNYMRQDPREYPPRHECSWTPRSTVRSNFKHQTLHPISNQVHHSLYRQPPKETTQNPTLREINTIIKGDHGHFTLDLTSCKYPHTELKIREPISAVQTIRESSNEKNNGHGNFLSTFKESKSLLSSPRESTGQRNSEHVDAVLTGVEIPNLMFSSRVSSIDLKKSHENDTFRRYRTTASSGSGYKVVLKKTTDEKIQQIFGRHYEKEKTFRQTLAHLNNKMKERLDGEQDVPHHVELFNKKLKSGGDVIEHVSKGVRNEFDRQKRRLNDLMVNKYEKSWKRWENLSQKPQPIQTMLRVSRESKNTMIGGGEEDSIVSKGPSRGNLILGDLISNIADKLKNEL